MTLPRSQKRYQKLRPLRSSSPNFDAPSSKPLQKQIQTGGEKGDPFTTYNLYLQNKPLPPTNKKNRFPLPGSPLKWKQSSSNHELFRCYCGYMHFHGFKRLWTSNGSSLSVNDALGGRLADSTFVLEGPWNCFNNWDPNLWLGWMYFAWYSILTNKALYCTTLSNAVLKIWHCCFLLTFNEWCFQSSGKSKEIMVNGKAINFLMEGSTDRIQPSLVVWCSPTVSYPNHRV